MQLAPNAEHMARHIRFVAEAQDNATVVVQTIDPLGTYSVATRRRVDDPDLLDELCRQNIGGKNHYLLASVTIPKWHGPKPPSITDKFEIANCPFSWCDIDYRTEESREDGSVRVLRLIEKLVADGSVPGQPSGHVSTGGGDQLYYRFDKPVTPEVCERVNRYLIAKLEGDEHAWNVNRVLRLGGSINHPNKPKIKKGRVPVLSHVVGLR